MRQAAPTREGRLRTIDQTAHRGAARLIPVHINELPSPRRASAHRRGPPRTARPEPPSACSADGGFQLPATRLSATIQFNPRSSGAHLPQKEPGATILFIVVGTASFPGDHRMDVLYSWAIQIICWLNKLGGTMPPKDRTRLTSNRTNAQPLV